MNYGSDKSKGMFADFNRIKFLFQHANGNDPKGWVRVITSSGTHVADFMTQRDAVAFCNAGLVNDRI